MISLQCFFCFHGKAMQNLGVMMRNTSNIVSRETI